MEIPLQITAKDIELTDAIKAEITEKAEKLDTYCDRIIRCRVSIDCPKKHLHEGKLYNIHIYLTVPGGELAVQRSANQDLYVSIRDAFQAARRKLEDFAGTQRGDVKFHEGSSYAVISKLFQDKGYGFLSTSDGTEIYFHANSLTNKGFSTLEAGMKVRFVKERGEKGPQASAVTVF